MHPLFTRRAWLGAFVLAWLLAGVLLAEFLRLVSPQSVTHAHAFAVPAMLACGFVMLSAWWVCRAHPLGDLPAHRVLGVQLGAALQASAAWAVMSMLWEIALTRLGDSVVVRADILRNLGVLFALGIPLYLLSAIVHYLFLVFEASHDAQRRVLESQVTAGEAEVRALRAQLNPHFLFNSLNSINSLIGSDPEGARSMCERLGDFLRRTLTLAARDTVTLAEELELVDRYLSIEQVRFGERLGVERHIDPAARECRVPPLLLQPLVENAIKHGVAGRLEGGVIRIDVRRDDTRLGIVVENPVDPDAPAQTGTGVGLDNVRRRLDAFGAEEGRLDAVREPGRFRVLLTLPAREPLAKEI
ncbi:MAG: histidine kinase [Candidatus Eisenbacteria bacterium]|nr:histidine kinase [Candidatus Eisenbacteria bacterium]